MAATVSTPTRRSTRTGSAKKAPKPVEEEVEVEVKVEAEVTAAEEEAPTITTEVEGEGNSSSIEMCADVIVEANEDTTEVSQTETPVLVASASNTSADENPVLHISSDIPLSPVEAETSTAEEAIVTAAVTDVAHEATAAATTLTHEPVANSIVDGHSSVYIVAMFMAVAAILVSLAYSILQWFKILFIKISKIGYNEGIYCFTSFSSKGIRPLPRLTARPSTE